MSNVYFTEVDVGKEARFTLFRVDDVQYYLHCKQLAEALGHKHPSPTTSHYFSSTYALDRIQGFPNWRHFVPLLQLSNFLTEQELGRAFSDHAAVAQAVRNVERAVRDPGTAWRKHVVNVRPSIEPAVRSRRADDEPAAGPDFAQAMQHHTAAIVRRLDDTLERMAAYVTGAYRASPEFRAERKRLVEDRIDEAVADTVKRMRPVIDRELRAALTPGVIQAIEESEAARIRTNVMLAPVVAAPQQPPPNAQDGDDDDEQAMIAQAVARILGNRTE
jgi:AcrR family transcriptional regulator